MKSTNNDALWNWWGRIIDGRKILLTSLLFAVIVTFLLATSEENHAYAQGPSGTTVGIPWHGTPGITKTVVEIMSHVAKAPTPNPLMRRVIPLRVSPRNPQLNANLTPFPPLLKAPMQLTLPKNPQPVGTNFLGTQYSDADCGPLFYCLPPDSMGAVGPSQILVVVNGSIKVFDHIGNTGALSTTLNLFFSTVLTNTNEAFDPRAHYDRLSGRWFVTALDSADTSNQILIAVSSGPAITSSSSFTFFSFKQDKNCPPVTCADNAKFADYDSLGVDANSLYIGVNIFQSSSGSFFNTTGYVINKNDLFSGTLTVTPFYQLISCATICGPYSPRGVSNDDPNATEGYFIGPDYSGQSVLTLRRITYIGGVPSISGNIRVSVPQFSYPIPVPAAGSSNPLDSLDTRLFNAQIHTNKLTGADSLWTAHNIEVDASGNGVPGGGRVGSRFYEITNLTTTPTWNQSGTLYDPSSTNPRFYWIPTVAMSGQGHMAMGTSFASVNDYAGIAVAGRFASDALDAIQSPTIVQTGAGAYNPIRSDNPQRWGDFSETVVDPNDDMTIWTFQEYANATDSWGVRAIQLKAPPPAFPVLASPANVAPGQSSVNVVITGTAISGSGFFDPGPDTGGPGFANHITATLTGGVTVNSVTFNSPTQITLNISTVGATLGGQHIVVTNPDGQSSTGYCVLTISESSTPSMCRQFFPFIVK